MKLQLLALIMTTQTLSAADSINFLNRTYTSFNQKASALWEFTSNKEPIDNWTTLLTLVDRPDAKTIQDLDRLAQGILDTYKAKGGKILSARTMQSQQGPFNYILVAFDQPAAKRWELNFVKIALAPKNAVIAIYGVRVSDPTDYTTKAKKFLSDNSQAIGMALEQATFPSTATLPRKEF
jgi:hypothetical protein